MKNYNLIYDYFTEKMKEHADICPSEISYKKARYVLSRFNIPQWMWMPVLKEMMNMEYLKRHNQQGILISDKQVDLDRINKVIEEYELESQRGKLTFEKYCEKKNGKLISN